MMISTKGRYALRVLIDMAEHQTDGYIPLNEIAKRQDISEKYLESIVISLVKGGVVDGMRINWVWMPPWGPEKITPDGRDQLRALGFNV